jgi:hypothetical protein
MLVVRGPPCTVDVVKRDGTLPDVGPDSHLLGRADQHRHLTAPTYAERAAALRTAGVTEAIADGVLERWLTAPFAANHRELRSRLRAMIVATDPEGYASCCEAIAKLDLRRDLPRRITAPTLVISGAEDPATPVDLQAQIAAVRRRFIRASVPRSTGQKCPSPPLHPHRQDPLRLLRSTRRRSARAGPRLCWQSARSGHGDHAVCAAVCHCRAGRRASSLRGPGAGAASRPWWVCRREAAGEVTDGEFAEVQVIEFDSEEGLESFQSDPCRLALSALRGASIAATTVIHGARIT